LAGQGFRVLRFWNNDVLNSTQSVLEAILVALGSCDATDFASHPLPNPSPLKGKGL
jgi:very-short-patch-repair endonuclease